MFEDRTYSKLMEEVLAMAPDGLDTRQGSIFFDSVSAIVNVIAKLYTDLNLVFQTVFLTSATGEYLDLRAKEYGITRLNATTAKYLFIHTGTTPDIGWRFFHNDSGYYFTLQRADDGTLYLEAEIAGTECNYIQEGDIAVPVNTVTGMTSAFFGAIYEYGTDTESDDSLRTRILEKIEGPAENGNRADYKLWCESVDGVGCARIEPLWIGENTVRGILISPLGLPAPDSVVNEVQQYIDPNDDGMTVEVNGKTYVFGDGKGNGAANIGAHFTACAAEELVINLAFNAELVTGVTVETAQERVAEAVGEYFAELALGTAEDELATVRLSVIGVTILSLTDCVLDYTDLTINGGTENIQAANEQVPVVGEVTINVIS